METFRRIRDAIIRGVDFLRDTKKELRNVSWPTRNELTGTTILVIIAVFFFAFYLFLIDQIIQPVITGFILGNTSI